MLFHNNGACLLAASLSVCSVGVRAEEAGAPAIASDIVVTANRTEERRENVASSMEVVGEEQLANTVALNFIDQLKKNASVDVIQYPNGLGGVGLRGLRPSFEFSINPQVLVLVDGRPSGSSSFTTIAPESITRVEVLKGPASALYGASAVGGVINIITRRSSGPLGGQFTVGGGSFQTIRSGATLGGDLVRGVDFDLDVGYVNQDGDFRLGNGARAGNSSFRRGSGRFRVGSTLSSIARLDASFDFASLDNDAPGPQSYNPRTPSGNQTDRITGDIRLELTPQDHAIRLIGYASRENYDYYTVPQLASRYVSSSTLTEYRGAQVQDSWRVLPALRLTYGGDWQRVEASRQSWNANGTGKAPSSPNESRETKALFAEAGLNLLDEGLILTAGGRYDWITVRTYETPYRINFTPGSANFGVFNPRGGAVFKLGGGFRLHGTIGRAFVPPQALQLAGESEEFAGIQRRVTYGNADLQPERNTTWDAGFGFAHGALFADITYFNARTRNRIKTELVSETPTLRQTSYVNADKSRMEGVEAQLALDAGAVLGLAPDRVRFNGSVTHIITAQDQTAAGVATAIRNVADWKATGSLTLSNGSTLFGTATVRFNGDRVDADNSQGRIFTNGAGGEFTLARFTTVDFSLRWQPTPMDGFRLEIANAFDVHYYEKADYWMPGRTAYVRYVRKL
ncbi:vitamin B12 transporter [Sphingobium sp. B1D3A]|uniref:Vitamin B12 transporter n=1 Tax=Sphingobium lignivorans TaxID=2735886 RepID=A0ABR6NHV6_9SPHN|nr:vitamin B12 transporter [Sphingobium lignivorans]